MHLLLTIVLSSMTALVACRTDQTAPREETAQPESGGGEIEPLDGRRVTPHGDWPRWRDTPELRASALARLEHLPSFGLGRRATEEDIASVDIDVMPNGHGLPPGRGTVARGKELYALQCVQCHGADGRGADYEALVGREPREGFPFSESLEYNVTVGNYWPYATTLYDYIHRAMPQAVPGSLPPDDVYSLVAYILYLNEIVSEDAVMDPQTLPAVEMPARDRFVYDDRAGGTELR